MNEDEPASHVACGRPENCRPVPNFKWEVGKEGHFGTYRRKWEDNIKMVLTGTARLCADLFDGGSSDMIWWRWCCNWIVCFCRLAVSMIIHPGYVIDEILVDLLSACQLLRRYCAITSSFCNTALYAAGLNWPWLQLKHCLSHFRMFSGFSVQQREWNASGFSTKPEFPFLIFSFFIYLTSCTCLS